MSDPRAVRLEPVAVSSESTVVAEYETTDKTASTYQSEAELETAFVRMLQEQSYEPFKAASEDDLISNLRLQLSKLNNIEFSDIEWKQFFNQCVASPNDTVKDKTRRIQRDHVQTLTRDDGTIKNISLIDKTNIHNNHLQVLVQYENEGARQNRYDVTVLVNGLPLVHTELKRRGVAIREAFNQINRYQRDSFWAGSGLYEYIQLFVISNGTHTKYYSNTVRESQLSNLGKQRSRSGTSDSFEFTNWWADAKNKRIDDLVDFTRTFFSKRTILNILTRYCAFTVDEKLMVMRPYQIAATEALLQRIATSTNHNQLGTLSAGGYVWHTTGTGKTFTSFKASQLATELPGVNKVVFVVDRKDLDHQTKREYENFAPGSVSSNKSTKVLRQQLADPDAKIVITTIQKLANFVKSEKKNKETSPALNQHVVFIFDECHRSQFGEMHTAITKAFKKYHLFGFTGTPIFNENASSGALNPNRRTTEALFGNKLHTYTIIDAIEDKNVLPFRIDYFNSVRTAGTPEDREVAAIDTEAAFLAPKRIQEVVTYIREHFDKKTKRSSSYRVVDRGTGQSRRLDGFNSLFATASIPAARAYYTEFQKQLKQAGAKPLKIGLIYSYAANPEEPELLADEEFETDAMPADDRTFLDDAISDYNTLFGTSYNTTAEQFESYYHDLTRRLKNRELDMVIVVNMFLTGFDAPTLNTLWVDKNLRAHGLLQAFSRTNRILNSIKTFGNIVCFRNLENATNESIALFGNKDARALVLLKPYSEYHSDYTQKVDDLTAGFTPGEQIVGESSQREFVQRWGELLKLRNILQAFDDFDSDTLLTDRQVQDYTSVYLDLHQEMTSRNASDRESIVDDLVFELELVKQVEVNVDYILSLVKQVQVVGEEAREDAKETLRRAVDASPTMRSKRELIEAFVESLTAASDVGGAWAEFTDAKRKEELDTLITESNLNRDAALKFVEEALRTGEIQEHGTGISELLPKMSRFSPDSKRSEAKSDLVNKLRAFVARFSGLH